MPIIKQKGFIHILGSILLLVILLGGVGVGLYLVQHSTIFKSKASQAPILDALEMTDSTGNPIQCDASTNPPTCNISSPEVNFKIKNINALITSATFNITKVVFAQEDSTGNTPGETPTTPVPVLDTSSNTQTCAQGNCNACATQTISACGNQNAYAGDCNFATACKNNPSGTYTCKSKENPNGCSFDQYDCSSCNSSVTGVGIINSVTTTPQSSPVSTNESSQCASDCNKCAKRYDSNLQKYTYDTCIDDKNQSSLQDPQSFCKNGATKFRCLASKNNNCVSDLEGSYSYTCPISTTPENASSPKPKVTVTSTSMNINGSNVTLGANFAQKITLPVADLTKESDIPIKIDAVYSDGQTKSFFITFHYKEKQATVPVVAKPSEQPIQTPIPANPISNNPSFACLPNPGLPIKVPVLVLEYYPPDPKNSNLLDGDETGWKEGAQADGRTIKFWEGKTLEMINKGIELINEATRYHGYKVANSPQFLNYSVLERKKYYQPIPNGYILEKKPKGNAVRPDYGGILKGLNICDYVDHKGVKEVWMYGYHNDNGIVPDESKMSSKYGDISNGQPKEESIPQQFRMPICKNSYVLYNFTYQPTGDPGNNLHNRMHQIENIIPFAEGSVFWPMRIWKGSDNSKGSIFWGNFSEVPNEFTGITTADGQRRIGYRSSCGNAHIPPNWTNAKKQEYRYDLNAQGEFNCETWNPDPSRTTYIKASCERWGCTDIGFYKWFMQNIPGYNNGIVYQGKSMRNWWEAMYDFNAFIEKDRSLFGGSIFCNSTTFQPQARVSTNQTGDVEKILQQYGEGGHEQETQP